MPQMRRQKEKNQIKVREKKDKEYHRREYIKGRIICHRWEGIKLRIKSWETRDKKCHRWEPVIEITAADWWKPMRKWKIPVKIILNFQKNQWKYMGKSEKNVFKSGFLRSSGSLLNDCHHDLLIIHGRISHI